MTDLGLMHLSHNRERSYIKIGNCVPMVLCMTLEAQFCCFINVIVSRQAFWIVVIVCVALS